MDRKERLRGFSRPWPAEQKEFSAAVGKLEAMVGEGLKELRRLRREEDEAEMEYWERMLRADVEAAPRDGVREMPEGVRRVNFYVDGSCPGNGSKGGGLMGAGVVRYCGDDRDEWSVPLGRGTNQRAELLAVIEALKAEADLGHAWVTVYSDSAYAVGVLGGGWKAKANHELVDLGRDMVRRCARFRMVQVKGHGGNRQHDRADELAGRAARAQKR